MTRRSFLGRLAADSSGSTIIEFALLGPVMLGMMLGALQLGVGMHGYNAMRSASADVARYAAVQYQTGNDLANSQIESYAQLALTRPPYGLSTSDVGVTVTNAGTQRVTGAKELTLTYTYRVPNLLTMLTQQDVDLLYSRPIFVIDS
ncbi:MAG: TadE/TadG family type IV pilus assembly protein [Novosphingobium sp.]